MGTYPPPDVELDSKRKGDLRGLGNKEWVRGVAAAAANKEADRDVAFQCHAKRRDKYISGLQQHWPMYTVYLSDVVAVDDIFLGGGPLVFLIKITFLISPIHGQPSQQVIIPLTLQSGAIIAYCFTLQIKWHLEKDAYDFALYIIYNYASFIPQKHNCRP